MEGICYLMWINYDIVMFVRNTDRIMSLTYLQKENWTTNKTASESLLITTTDPSWELLSFQIVIDVLVTENWWRERIKTKGNEN